MTGWRPYPVVIVDKSKQKHSDYDGIAIVGRSGPVTYEGSPYRRYDMPGGTFHFRTGLRCDPSGWSDDDLSMSSDSGKGWTFCSPRFRELNERLRVSQFECTDVDDIQNDADRLEEAETSST